MVSTCLHVYAIVWSLFRAIHSVRFCTLAVMLDVMAAESNEISMTTLSLLGVVDLSALGGCWQYHSGWGLWFLQ